MQFSRCNDMKYRQGGGGVLDRVGWVAWCKFKIVMYGWYLVSATAGNISPLSSFKSALGVVYRVTLKG